MNTQKNLKVSILGKSYLIATDEDAEDILQAAELIDNLMTAKTDKTGLANVNVNEKIAIIVALEIATDLIKKKKLLKVYERRTGELSSMISHELTSPEEIF